MRIICETGFRQKRMVAAALAWALLGTIMAAQQPPGGAQDQRAAMQKLAFLAGSWSGPVTVVRGPGEPLRLKQSENVEFKLNGLVLLIEGHSISEDGKTQFEALATVAYDDATRTYRIRAYNGGHYIDTELSVVGDGFSWGFQAGPAHVINTMRLNPGGQWQETTEATMGNNPAQKSVEMVLDRR